jgi:hypothetical protein
MISKKQIKAIWALAHREGLEEEELRKLVESFTGKKSIRSLSQQEAGEIIEDLLLKGVKAGWAFQRAMDKEKRGTRAQIAFIGGLSRQIGWDQSQALGLARRMYGVQELTNLKVNEASGLIEALKAIRRRWAA